MPPCFIFPLSVMLAFLVLAALYESWTLPLAVVLIVPMCMLSALVGVWLTGGDNNVFVQVGLVVLMGLACKNAILIVEFARELEIQGKGIVEAALEACRLRLRPIVMTSIAFIAGTVPLLARPWRWRRGARRHRRHRVRRHAGRDSVRPVPYAGVLRRPAQDGAQDTGRVERPRRRRESLTSPGLACDRAGR